MSNTYDSLTDLGLGSVPMVDDPSLYQELLDIHNAIETLLSSADRGTGDVNEEVALLKIRVAQLELELTQLGIQVGNLTVRVSTLEGERIRLVEPYVDGALVSKNDMVCRGTTTAVALAATTDLPDSGSANWKVISEYPTYLETIVPETALDENSGEVTLAEVSVLGQEEGRWRFGFDVRWAIAESGGVKHRAIFRLYSVLLGVPTFIGDYKQEPKDLDEVFWASNGQTFEFVATEFDALRLTVEQSDGAQNPELLIYGGGSLYVERKPST